MALVKALMAVYPYALQCSSNAGDLPLHVAAVQHQRSQHGVSVVIMLLTACTQTTQRKNRIGRLPLHFVAHYQTGDNGLAVVMALLAAHPRAAQQTMNDGWLPLHVAARHQRWTNGKTALLTAYTNAVQRKTLLPVQVAQESSSTEDASNKVELLQAATEGWWQPPATGPL